MPEIRAPELELLHGYELFHASGNSLGLTLLDYWRWSGSDLLSNAERGVVAEFLVASALGTADEPRVEWAAYDVKTKEGDWVEVKSASYRQSWAQDKAKVPKISFDISKSKQSWDRGTIKAIQHDPPKRVSSVYVFCVLGTEEGFKDEIVPNPLNTDEWSFYVLDTASLPDQKTIGLKPLCQLVKHGAVKYADLREAIRDRSA